MINIYGVHVYFKVSLVFTFRTWPQRTFVETLCGLNRCQVGVPSG